MEAAAPFAASALPHIAFRFEASLLHESDHYLLPLFIHGWDCISLTSINPSRSLSMTSGTSQPNSSWVPQVVPGRSFCQG